MGEESRHTHTDMGASCTSQKEQIKVLQRHEEDCTTAVAKVDNEPTTSTTASADVTLGIPFTSKRTAQQRRSSVPMISSVPSTAARNAQCRGSVPTQGRAAHNAQRRSSVPNILSHDAKSPKAWEELLLYSLMNDDTKFVRQAARVHGYDKDTQVYASHGKPGRFDMPCTSLRYGSVQLQQMKHLLQWDILRKVRLGDTALHIALRCGAIRVAQFLVRAGAATDIRNDVGESAMGMDSELINGSLKSAARLETIKQQKLATLKVFCDNVAIINSA